MCYRGEEGVEGAVGIGPALTAPTGAVGPTGERGEIGQRDHGLSECSGCGDCKCSDIPSHVPQTSAAVAPALEEGLIALRAAWLVKESNSPMAIFLVNGSEFVVNREPLISILPEGTVVTYRKHVDALYSVVVGTGQDEGKVKCEVGVYRFTKEDTDAADWIIMTKADFLAKFMQS